MITASLSSGWIEGHGHRRPQPADLRRGGHGAGPRPPHHRDRPGRPLPAPRHSRRHLSAARPGPRLRRLAARVRPGRAVARHALRRPAAACGRAGDGAAAARSWPPASACRRPPPRPSTARCRPACCRPRSAEAAEAVPHDHSSAAWRLRHAKRSVLRETTSRIDDVSQLDDEDLWRSTAAPRRRSPAWTRRRRPIGRLGGAERRAHRPRPAAHGGRLRPAVRGVHDRRHAGRASPSSTSPGRSARARRGASKRRLRAAASPRGSSAAPTPPSSPMRTASRCTARTAGSDRRRRAASASSASRTTPQRRRRAGRRSLDDRPARDARRRRPLRALRLPARSRAVQPDDHRVAVAGGADLGARHRDARDERARRRGVRPAGLRLAVPAAAAHLLGDGRRARRSKARRRGTSASRSSRTSPRSGSRSRTSARTSTASSATVFDPNLAKGQRRADLSHYGVASVGDFAASGWGVGVSRPVGTHLRGGVEYRTVRRRLADRRRRSTRSGSSRRRPCGRRASGCTT